MNSHRTRITLGASVAGVISIAAVACRDQPWYPDGHAGAAGGASDTGGPLLARGLLRVVHPAHRDMEAMKREPPAWRRRRAKAVLAQKPALGAWSRVREKEARLDKTVAARSARSS